MEMSGTVVYFGESAEVDMGDEQSSRYEWFAMVSVRCEDQLFHKTMDCGVRTDIEISSTHVFRCKMFAGASNRAWVDEARRIQAMFSANEVH